MDLFKPTDEDVEKKVTECIKSNLDRICISGNRKKLLSISKITFTNKVLDPSLLTYTVSVCLRGVWAEGSGEPISSIMTFNDIQFKLGEENNELIVFTPNVIIIYA